MTVWRTMLCVMATLLLLNIAVHAQKGAKPKPAQAGPEYVCLMCKVGADKQDKCPICKLQMAKAGIYVYTGYGAMADKPGGLRPMQEASGEAIQPGKEVQSMWLLQR